MTVEQPPRLSSSDGSQSRLPGYRAKRMALSQWAPFRKAFEQFFMAGGADRQMALFIEWHRPSDGSSMVMIPDYQSEIVEQLSPGGWRALPDAPQRRWTVLVGNATALGDFGLNIAG